MKNIQYSFQNFISYANNLSLINKHQASTHFSIASSSASFKYIFFQFYRRRCRRHRRPSSSITENLFVVCWVYCLIWKIVPTMNEANEKERKKKTATATNILCVDLYVCVCTFVCISNESNRNDEVVFIAMPDDSEEFGVLLIYYFFLFSSFGVRSPRPAENL